MPQTWMESLRTTKHPFDLSQFVDAQQYPGWFQLRSDEGDRAATLGFEGYFRRHAGGAIEPWLEAIYWQLSGDVGVRDTAPQTADYVTLKMASRLQERGVSPGTLWRACINYMEQPTKKSLFVFKTVLGTTWGAIGIASLFPALMRPDWYPAVDRRIARWVGGAKHAHNAADPAGPQLVRPHFLDTVRPVLSTRDFPFVESWFRWCWYTAHKLSARTAMTWRSRDVELAVVTAWGGPGDANPKLRLSPLAGVG